MIKIPGPCMVMNAHNVPYPWYRHTNTWNVAKDVTAQGLLGWAAKVFQGFKDKEPGQRATLVMNCHGFYRGENGGYGLGMGRGVRASDIVQFEKIAPYVDDIVIVACGAAAGGDGISCDSRVFDLGKVAATAKATVTGATSEQWWEGNYSATYLPVGYIDNWEGKVLKYGPDGALISSTDASKGMSLP